MTDFEKTVKTTKPTKIQKVGDGKFDAHLAFYPNGWKAICKPALHTANTYRQLPVRLAHRREEAFFHLGEVLVPGFVPETYVCKVNDVECSAQMFVPGMHVRAWDKKVFRTSREDFSENFKKIVYSAAPKEVWKRLTVLDLVGNSRDRHGKNVIIRPGYISPVAAIDNGFSLGLTFRAYRNVFHKYLFNYHFYDPSLLHSLEKIKLKDITDAIVPLLDPIYAEHVMRRIEWILEYPHRLPFRVMCRGEETFPTYKAWFSDKYRRLPERKLLVKSTAQAA